MEGEDEPGEWGVLGAVEQATLTVYTCYWHWSLASDWFYDLCGVAGHCVAVSDATFIVFPPGGLTWIAMLFLQQL